MSRKGGAEMKRRLITGLMLLLILEISGLAQSDSESSSGKKSTNDYPRIRTYSTFLARMKSISSPHITRVKIGTINYGTSSYDVFTLSFKPVGPAKKRIILVSGLHGNETAGPEAVLSFFRELTKHPKDYENLAIDAIPMVNPWGWEHNVRYSGDGYDINRDFIAQVTQEAAIVAEFGRDRIYDLVIDHHEAHADGAFIYCYDDRDYALSLELMESLKADGYAVAKTRYNSRWAPENGVVHISNRFGIYGFRGRTAAHFFKNDYRSHAFTMETSVYKKFRDRAALHLFVMKFLIGRFAGD
jgi:hypothetical protein